MDFDSNSLNKPKKVSYWHHPFISINVTNSCSDAIWIINIKYYISFFSKQPLRSFDFQKK